MAAAARREEANLLVRQRHQVLVGGRDVCERVAAEHFLNALGRRVGIVDQVDFRLGGSVAGEGVVEQVVEHLAVLPRAAGVVVLETHRAPFCAACGV